MSGERNKIIWLLVAAFVARLAFALIFDPFIFRDSHDYLQLARIIGSGDYSGYNGARTPLYPLVILLFDFNVHTVVIFQFFLGLLITLVIYQSFKRIFASSTIGFAAGLSYALNPSQLVFEYALLTETAATALISFSFFAFIISLKKGCSPRLVLLVGTLGSLAALTKPLFQFLPLLLSLLIACFYYFNVERRLFGALTRFSLVILPALVILGGWSLFNYERTGSFAVTTLTGFNLSNHTGAFIEFAPEEYAQIREIYLEHRRLVLKETGTSSMTILKALDDLQARTGLSFAELSRRFMDMSIYLVCHHPARYLRSAAKSFVIFWLPTWYAGRGGWLAVVRHGTEPAQRPFLIFYGAIHISCMLTFIIFPFLFAFSRRIREYSMGKFEIFTIYAIVFAAAPLQALIEYGENARYKQPVEPLIIALAVSILLHLYGNFRRRGQSEAS